jgi:uncharacterized membrane protein YuzA (DUF378 family)
MAKSLAKKLKPWFAGFMVAGAANWLLIGLIDFNLVAYLVGLLPEMVAWLERAVYILAGLGGAGALWEMVSK